MLATAPREFKGITSYTTYVSGEMQECKVNEPNLIRTQYGDFVPQYSRPDTRRKELKSLSFYKSGNIRSLCLEQQTDVATPIGIFPAELVTFYDDGSLNSVFPLNGQIGFGWSQEEEGALAQTYDFEFSFGKISAKIIGMRFYPSGKIKSLILWPGQVVTLQTPAGVFPVRIGFRLFENGQLESFEPAIPIALETPVGAVTAYDVNALGIDADSNSVRFDNRGRLTHIATSGDIIVHDLKGGRKMISSRTKLGLMDDTLIKMPIELSFYTDTVVIDNGIHASEFKTREYKFLVLPDIDETGFKCEGGCDGCPGCL